MLREELSAETPTSGLADPARLRAVARLRVGAWADAAFDRIAGLVERLVDVPVALVTIVSADTQFLPGQIGLPDDLAEAREMGLGHSFSRHVVEAGQAMVVADVRNDPLLRDNLSIRDLGAVAYVGVPLTDSDGLVVGTLAVMDREPRQWTRSEIAVLTDLGEICSSELRLRIAREIADEARLRAESAHDQLSLLGELTEALAATMDIDVALRQLGRMVAGRLADWCVVVLAEPSGTVRHVSVAHGSPAYAREAERLAELAGAGEPGAEAGRSEARAERRAADAQRRATERRGADAQRRGAAAEAEQRGADTQGRGVAAEAGQRGARADVRSLIRAVQRRGGLIRRDEADPLRPHEEVARVGSPEMAQVVRRMGFGSYLLVPVTTPVTQRVIGALLLVNGPGRLPFEESEERTAIEVGRRAGLAVDNSRLYRHQRHVAEVLQHSMLPELPRLDGIDLHARYLPAQDGAAVGGDWYDAFAQPDGSVMLAVGDVSGHDIEAAATMGQVRNLVRGDAYGRDDSPGPLLAQLDRALHGLGVPAAATAVLARVRRDGDDYLVSFANAGHPPPVLLDEHGEVHVWWATPEPLLGLIPRDDRTTHERRVRRGSTLLLYTDGLVEHPARLIDDGIGRLRGVLRGNAALPPEDLCARLIEAAPRRADDIALLAVSLR